MKKATAFVILLIPVLLFTAQTERQKNTKVSPEKRAWLGLSVSDISVKMLSNLGLENGIKVTKVYAESPAESAGLEEDDILTSFDGKKLSSADELVDYVGDSEIGQTIKMGYVRSGQEKIVEIKLAERERTRWFMKRPPRMLRIYSDGNTWLGVRTDNLSDQLRKYFGAPEDIGILISEVIKDSPAENAGLKAGDVILRLGEKEINDTGDLVRAVNYFEPNETVEVEVIREKSRKKFNVKLGEKEKQHKFHRYGLHPDMKYDAEDFPEMEIIIPDVEIDAKQFQFDHEELEIMNEQFNQQIEVKLQLLDKQMEKLGEKLKKISIRLKNVTV